MVTRSDFDDAIQFVESYAGRTGRLPRNASSEDKFRELSAGLALLARTMRDVIIRHVRQGPDWEVSYRVPEEGHVGDAVDSDNKITITHDLNVTPDRFVVTQTATGIQQTSPPTAVDSLRLIESDESTVTFQVTEDAVLNQLVYHVVLYRIGLAPVDADTAPDTAFGSSPEDTPGRGPHSALPYLPGAISAPPLAVLVDGSRDFTADQSMAGNKLTNLADGTALTDAINLGQRGYATFRSVSSNTTLTASDNVVFVDTTGGDIDINVPSGLNVGGKLYNIINVGVNTVNVRVL